MPTVIPEFTLLSSQGPDFTLIAAISAVPIRDEASPGNERFITAVTLLEHPLAISSDL